MIFIFSNVCYAADLDAPAEKKITVKSEIQRGYSVISRIDVSNYATDPLKYIDAVEKKIDINKQNNTDTDGFYLGLYFQAWTKFDMLLSYIPDRYTPQAKELCQQFAVSYYKEFKKYQQQLDIDNQTLFNALEFIPTALNAYQPKFDEYDKKIN